MAHISEKLSAPNSPAEVIFTPRRTRIAERVRYTLEGNRTPKELFLATGQAALLNVPPVEFGRPSLHSKNSNVTASLLIQQADMAAASKANRLTDPWDKDLI